MTLILFTQLGMVINVVFQSLNFVGSVDNISVKEVGQHWTFGTGWSTDGTKAMFDDVNDGTYISQSLTLK